MGSVTQLLVHDIQQGKTRAKGLHVGLQDLPTALARQFRKAGDVGGDDHVIRGPQGVPLGKGFWIHYVQRSAGEMAAA